MQNLKKYKASCLECGESDIITVDETHHVVVDYERKVNTPFRSFRWRGDGKWGFFCGCGNDNRLAPMEAEGMDNLVMGDPKSLKKIAASLLIPDEKQFKLEPA